MRPIPLRVVIADDEPLARDALRASLDRHADVELVGEAVDGPDAVELVRTLDPDLLLLDIRMPGLDGFQVVETVGPDAMPAVVFVSAWDDRALDAFRVHALDYLLKPFDDQRFDLMLRRVRERARAREAGDLARRLEALLERQGEPGPAPGAPPEPLRRIQVPREDRILFVDVVDLDVVEADGNYVILHCGPVTHRLRQTLAALEESLDSRTFVRVHRSFILNRDRLVEVHSRGSGDYTAVLRGGRQIPVSRHFRQRLLGPG